MERANALGVQASAINFGMALDAMKGWIER